MEPQNKEFPSFSGPETSHQTDIENRESTEGEIIGQPLSPEEKQEMEQDVTDQQETLIAPSLAEAPVLEQSQNASARTYSEVDHTANHLRGDNKIETSGDAHDVLNDLLSGNYKP